MQNILQILEDFTNFLQSLQNFTNFCKSLQGSFSAVSRPRKNSILEKNCKILQKKMQIIANYFLILPTPKRYPEGSRADLQLNDSFGSLGSRSKTTLTRIILIAKQTDHLYIQGTGELHSFVSVPFDLRNSTGFIGQFWNARELRAFQKSSEEKNVI